MIQLQTTEGGLPLCGIAYIKKLIRNFNFDKKCPTPSSKEIIARDNLPPKCEAEKLSTEDLYEVFKDRINCLDDLKKQSIEERKIIRDQFPLDIDFINFLQKRKNNRAA